jgi:hypothetical protein
LEKFYGRSCGLKKKPKVKHDREMGRRKDREIGRHGNREKKIAG